MAGNRRCSPGCTCKKHSAEFREAARLRALEQFEQQGGAGVRAERTRSQWASRSSEKVAQLVYSRKRTLEDAPARVPSAEERSARSSSARNAWSTKTADERRDRTRAALHSRAVLKPATRLEIHVAACLDILEIEYSFQHPVGNLLVDFYLPEFHLCLEADGAYWHRDPAKQVARDLVLKEQGYRVAHLVDRAAYSRPFTALVDSLVDALQ